MQQPLRSKRAAVAALAVAMTSVLAACSGDDTSSASQVMDQEQSNDATSMPADDDAGDGPARPDPEFQLVGVPDPAPGRELVSASCADPTDPRFLNFTVPEQWELTGNGTDGIGFSRTPDGTTDVWIGQEFELPYNKDQSEMDAEFQTTEGRPYEQAGTVTVEGETFDVKVSPPDDPGTPTWKVRYELGTEPDLTSPGGRDATPVYGLVTLTSDETSLDEARALPIFESIRLDPCFVDMRTS